MKKVKFFLGVCLFAMLLYGRMDIYANNHTITITAKQGADIAKMVNVALEEASELGKKEDCIYTVKISPGTYNLGRTLYLYGNTKLDATGSTLTTTRKVGNMIMNCNNDFNKSAEAAGYGKDSNMTILGGTWICPKTNTSCIMRFSHCSNLSLVNCTIEGGTGAHQVEVCAIDGFTVKGCTFKDMLKSAEKGGREALQIDIPICKVVYPYTYEDGTITKNVTVTNCTFSNVARGVGSHNVLIGAYMDNIVISNNNFTNVKAEAITASNYINCEIKNNTFTNCGGGVLFTMYKSSSKAVYSTIFEGTKAFIGKTVHDVNTQICDNTFNLRKDSAAAEITAIKFAGYKQEKTVTATNGGVKNRLPKCNYYISGVTVADNIINTPGYGIHLMNVRAAKITHNTIKSKGSAADYDGISMEKGCRAIVVTNNKISNCRRDGIVLKNDSKATQIVGNKVTASKRYGIFIYGTVAVTEKLSQNNISKCKDAGIEINVDALINGFEKNKITKCKTYAVRLGFSTKAVVGKNYLSGNKKNCYSVRGKNGVSDAKNYSAVKLKSYKKQKNKVTFEWKKIKGVTGYRIEYSEYPDFTNYKYKDIKKEKVTLFLKNANEVSYYYVRIRAFKKANKITVLGDYGKLIRVKGK